jgi:thioester reductase-like protein
MVTGGTGFVGSCIILELLRQTDVEIICLVRPGKEPVESRLQKALVAVAQAYAYDETIISAIGERCHALSGNVLAEHFGLTALPQAHIAQFWHCAASLKYEDRYEAEIFATNVDGTRHAVELARTLGVERFNYVSTAYVAGRQKGVILEMSAGSYETNNLYEVSKIKAEEIVSSIKDIPTRIFRPSIVIGHSQTYAVSGSFSGLYGFMRKLLQFRGMMSRIQEGYLTRNQIRMRIDVQALVNLIPVDIVARQAVQISLSNSPAAIFHLTNPTPPTTEEFMKPLFERLQIAPPLYVENKDEFSWIDGKFDQGISFYTSYLTGYKVFDRTNSDAVVAQSQESAFPMPDQTLLAFYEWYLERLIAQRSNLISSR